MSDFITSPHILGAFYNSKRYLPLLLIPLGRSAYNLLSGAPFRLIIGADIIAAIALICFELARVRAYKIRICNNHLIISRGVIVKTKSIVPLANVAGVYIYKSPVSAALGAVRVRVDTDAGRNSNPDFEFYYSARAVDTLTRLIIGDGAGGERRKCSAFQILLLSLTSASALSGLLVCGAVSASVGKFFGKNVGDYVVNTLSNVSYTLSKTVPEIAAVIASLFLAGFIVSFLLTFIKHLSFTAAFGKRIIYVSQGFLWRKYSYIRRDAVGAISFKQSPIMRLFRRGSLLAFVAGYRTRDGESAVIMPVLRVINDDTHSVAGFDRTPELTVKAPRRALHRVFVAPTLCLFAVIALPFALSILNINVNVPLSLLFAVIYVLLYWIYVRYICFKHGGIMLCKLTRTRTGRAFTLIDTEYFTDRVDSVLITSNPFDRGLNLCTVRTELYSQQRLRTSVRNLDLSEVMNEIGIN